VFFWVPSFPMKCWVWSIFSRRSDDPATPCHGKLGHDVFLLILTDGVVWKRIGFTKRVQSGASALFPVSQDVSVNFTDDLFHLVVLLE